MSASDPRKPADPKRPPTTPDPVSLPEIDFGAEGAVDLGDLKSAEAIDFAALPEPPSGQSLTSWTAVIKRQKLEAEAAAAVAGGPVRVDAPSDKDLLERLAAQARKPGDTKEIPTADLPLFTGPTGRSESDIDLGRMTGGTGTSESEVKFDILYPPSDAGGVMPAPKPPLSAVDFRAVTVPLADPTSGVLLVPDAGPTSGVLLGADTGPPGEGGQSSILDALLNGPDASNGSAASVLEFGAAVPPPPSTPSTPEVGGRELVDSDAGTGSEEAIDLYAEPVPSPSITDSGTLEISREALAESQRRNEAEQSSSVDLSSRPGLHSGEFDQMLEAPSKAGLQSDADIDLNLPATGEDGDSSMVYRQRELDANRAALEAEFQARRKTDDRPKRKRGEVVPAGDRPDRGRSGRSLIHGGVIGLLLGAGAVLAAHFAGVLPNRKADDNQALANDSIADLARTRNEAAQSKIKLDELSAQAKVRADEISRLRDLKAAGDTEIKRRADEAAKAQADLAAAQQKVKDAELAERAARTELTTAKKAATEAAAAKQTADSNLAALTKSLRNASIDPAKPGDALKTLTDARAAAEAKAKEAEAKVTEAQARAKEADTKAKDADARAADAAKKVSDLTALAETAKKSADDARKSAEDAVKAREAGAAIVRAIADRLVKAKFVGDKADGPALLKGIDDALKAGSTDATATLRTEITKLRADAEKAQAELTAAKDREAKAIQAAQERETKAVQAAKERETKAVQAAKDGAAAAVKSATEAKVESQRELDIARAEAERATAEVARLKAETERLTRDLAVVRELADLIKTQMPAAGPGTKVDPVRLADQSFGDGLHSFYGGQYTEAESALRKAIQFRAADARYHYLLGLTLWMRKETVAAEAEFQKGRDLESQGLPSSRLVSATLERIQGPARQAVDAYRP